MMLNAVERPGQQARSEARWPVALAIVAVVFLLGALPGRIRVASPWIPYILGAAVLVPMLGIGVGINKGRWLRLERRIIAIFFLIAGAGVVANLVVLVRVMVSRTAEVSGLSLLTSSVGVWISNVLVFSLLYWQLDRGGPEARERGTGPRPDWRFPQDGASPYVPTDWRPTFIDYLFLGFTSATAFSPTDAIPLTSRAKMITMLESAISLVTTVVVASRAISLLGR